MKRYYTFDEHYFDTIDADNKAYILGLLFADGYNHEGRGVVSLSLSQTDKEILDKINETLKSDRPLQFIDMQKYHNGKSHQNQYRLNLSSRHTSSTLSTLGCSQCKSKTLLYPRFLSSNLTSHFIRGYFDGDGCISYSALKNGRLYGSVSFVSSKLFCEEVAKILTSIEITSSIIADKKYDPAIRILKFGGRHQIQKFYDFMYKNATLYLHRKKDTFENFLEETQVYLTKHKSTNVYRNTAGSKLPFRVVKTVNYKSIHLGSFKTQDEAQRISEEWDIAHASTLVTAL